MHDLRHDGAMGASLLADAVLLLHGLFIAWVIAGSAAVCSATFAPSV